MDTQTIYERKFLHYCHHYLMPRFGYYDFPKFLQQKEVVLTPVTHCEIEENAGSLEQISLPNQLITLTVEQWSMKWEGYLLNYSCEIPAIPVQILKGNGASAVYYIHELCTSILNCDFEYIDSDDSLEVDTSHITRTHPDTDAYIHLLVSGDYELDTFDSKMWYPHVAYIL